MRATTGTGEETRPPQLRQLGVQRLQIAIGPREIAVPLIQREAFLQRLPGLIQLAEDARVTRKIVVEDCLVPE